MSRLNRIAALVGLVAGGLATWALLRYQPGPTPTGSTCGCSCRCHDIEGTPAYPGPCAGCCEPGMNCDCGRALIDLALDEYLARLDAEVARITALPEWMRRLAERPGPSAEWYARRHHCTDDVIGRKPGVHV